MVDNYCSYFHDFFFDCWTKYHLYQNCRDISQSHIHQLKVCFVDIQGASLMIKMFLKFKCLLLTKPSIMDCANMPCFITTMTCTLKTTFPIAMYNNIFRKCFTFTASVTLIKTSHSLLFLSNYMKEQMSSIC